MLGDQINNQTAYTESITKLTIVLNPLEAIQFDTKDELDQKLKSLCVENKPRFEHRKINRNFGNRSEVVGSARVDRGRFTKYGRGAKQFWRKLFLANTFSLKPIEKH